VIKLSVEFEDLRVEYRVSSVDELEGIFSEIRKIVERGDRRRCIRNSWYIRVRPEILLDIIVEAYNSYKLGVVKVGEVVERYLQDRGYSKSLARVITPTISALGLSEEGVFNRRAIEYGKMLSSTRSPRILEKALEENCIINEVVSEARRGCRSLDEVVVRVFENYGKSIRRDEVAYTSQLIRMVYGDLCENLCAQVVDVARGSRDCVGSAPSEDCRSKEYFAKGLLDSCKDVIVELFNKLDIGIRLDSIEYKHVKGGVYIASTKNRPIGVVAFHNPLLVEESDLVNKVRSALVSLDNDVEELMRGELYEFYIKLVPIVQRASECGRLRVFVEVVRADLEKASKLVTLSRSTSQ